MRRLLIVLLAFSFAMSANPHSVSGQDPTTAVNPHFNPHVPTVWHKLGVPQGVGRFKKFRASRVNRKGNNPDKEKKPRLLSLTDPANLAPEAPKMLQVAAKIKKAEDLAPQKLKALKYIGTIGCGCYNKQNADMVEAAVLEGLADCTTAVRREALNVVMKQISGGCNCSCGQSSCNSKSCCTPKIYKALCEMANKTDNMGCPAETDPAIRALAMQVLNACPVPMMDVQEEPEEVEEEEEEAEEAPPELEESGDDEADDENEFDFEGDDPGEADINGPDGETSDDADAADGEDAESIEELKELDDLLDEGNDGDEQVQKRRVRGQNVSYRRTSSLPGNRSLSAYSQTDRAFMQRLEVTGVVRSVREEDGNVTIVFDEPYEFPQGLNVVIATDRNNVSFGVVKVTKVGTAVIAVEDYKLVQQLGKLKRVRLGVFQ